jgi:hypothetical protein
MVVIWDFANAYLILMSQVASIWVYSMVLIDLFGIQSRSDVIQGNNPLPCRELSHMFNLHM